MRALAFVLLFVAAALPATGAVTTLPVPIVVVYPFSITSGASDPESGGRLAVLIASKLATAGGLELKPGTPGTSRSQFLDDARKIGADYYVTGYLTPLGDEVSLVDQVVSTYSGIVVWSSTTQVRTYDEALGQTDVMRDAILQHEGRTLAQLGTPAPLAAASPSPAPAGQNLNKLFSRHPKATPAPAAAATRAPAPPPPPAPRSSGVVAVAPGGSPVAAAAIVVNVGGDASVQDRAHASGALASALAKAGLGGTLIATSANGDLPGAAQQLCSKSGAGSIYSGNLSLQQKSGAFVSTSSANFELLRYDCHGTVTTRQRAQTSASGHAGSANAIDRAVAQTVTAALAPSKTKRT